jgi:hypothetical protein
VFIAPEPPTPSVLPGGSGSGWSGLDIQDHWRDDLVKPIDKRKKRQRAEAELLELLNE